MTSLQTKNGLESKLVWSLFTHFIIHVSIWLLAIYIIFTFSSSQKERYRLIITHVSIWLLAICIIFTFFPSKRKNTD